MTTTADTYNRLELTEGRLTYRHLTRLVELFQASGTPHGELPDGLFGPATRARLEALMAPEAVTRKGMGALPLSGTPLEQAGQKAANAAIALWELDVYDPSVKDQSSEADRCRAVIENIFVAAGWGFACPYLGNGPPQWCGLFAAKCWREAGIDPSWLATYFASTYRLQLWTSYQKFDAKHPNPKPAPVLATFGDYRGGWHVAGMAPSQTACTPRAGDIVVVGDGEPAVGDHITIAIGYDPAIGAIDTISGNGGGMGPTGKQREGISRRTYLMGPGAGYRVLYIHRPAYWDLRAEAGTP